MSITTYTALGNLTEKNKGLSITSYTSSTDFLDDLSSKLPTGDNVIYVIKAAHTGSGIPINMSTFTTNPSTLITVDSDNNNNSSFNFYNYTGTGEIFVLDSSDYIPVGQLLNFTQNDPSNSNGTSFTGLCISHDSTILSFSFLTAPTYDGEVTNYRVTSSTPGTPNLTDFINIPIRIVNDNASFIPGQRDGDVLTITVATGKIFVIENGESATLVQYSSGNWSIVNSILPPVNAILSGIMLSGLSEIYLNVPITFTINTYSAIIGSYTTSEVLKFKNLGTLSQFTVAFSYSSGQSDTIFKVAANATIDSFSMLSPLNTLGTFYAGNNVYNYFVPYGDFISQTITMTITRN